MVALFVRILVLIQLLPQQADRGFYRHNEPARIAWALVSGYGFSSPWPNTPLAPTAQQPPVYPLLLAAIFKVAGIYSYLSLWIAVTLNAVFSSVTAVLILRLGERVFCRSVGTLAAWVWACWLYEAVVSIRLWESSLSALLLVTILTLLSRAGDFNRLAPWLLLGLFSGVAGLTNTTLLSLFPFFWSWLWMKQHVHNKACTRQMLASIGLCALLLLPWTVRNYIEFHRFIPVRNNFGMELWVGNHEGVTYLYDFSTGFPLSDPTEYNRLGEMRFMDEKRATAIRFIEEHPSQFLRLCGQRFASFWSAPAPHVWLPFSILAGAGGVFMFIRRRLDAVPYGISLLVFPLVYYVTHPWSTYRHPIEPVMILLTAYLVTSMWELISQRRDHGRG